MNQKCYGNMQCEACKCYVKEDATGIMICRKIGVPVVRKEVDHERD